MRLRVGRVLGVLALLGGVGVVYVGVQSSTGPVPPRPAPLEIIAPLAADGFELGSFTVPEAQLTTLVRRPRRAESPWLVIFGGNADEMLRGNRELALRIAGSDDVGVATLAYRGFDTSTGIAAPETFAPDAVRFFDHLASRYGVRPGQVHVVSFSLGTWYAVGLVTELARRGTPPGSTSLLSPGLSSPKNPPWAVPFVRGPYRLHESLASVPDPVLVVTATADESFPLEAHGRVVRDLLGADRVTYLELEGGHTRPLEAEASLRVVRRAVGLPGT